MFNFPIAGYPITKAPVNLPAFWSLGNRGWVSNYGMETQYNLFPSYASDLETFLAHNVDTLGTTNPMLYGIVNANNGKNDLLSQQGIFAAAQQGFSQGLMIRASVAVERANSALNSMASQLENILSSDKLDDSQKARIQALLDKVNAAQKRLQELTQEFSQTSDPQNVLKALTNFQQEVLALQKEGSELAKEISEEIKNNTSSSSTSDSTDSTTENTTNNTSDGKDKYDENGRPASLQKPSDREIKNICLEFADAIGKKYLGFIAGTDDEKFNTAVAALDEHNIIEVMKYWKENFCGAGKQYDNDRNFIDSFLLDADADQKVKLGRHILDTLVKRAELNGIDVTAEEAMLRKELNSSVYIDNDVFEKYIEAIYTKITEKEAQNAQSVKDKKTETKKAENDKKIEADKKRAEKVEEMKQQFIQDMKECLERDDIKELPSGVEVVKDDKGNFKGFKIRIKGKDYFGKDYLALTEALEKDGAKLPLPAKKTNLV